MGSHQFDASASQEVPADSCMSRPGSGAPHIDDIDARGARSASWLTQVGNGPLPSRRGEILRPCCPYSARCQQQRSDSEAGYTDHEVRTR